jgi:hypothetical protein
MCLEENGRFRCTELFLLFSFVSFTINYARVGFPLLVRSPENFRNGV